MLTHDYHIITLQIIPLIKLHTKWLQQIYCSLEERNAPNMKTLLQYFSSGKDSEEFKSVMSGYFIKIQEIAPKFVQIKAPKYGLASSN